MANNAYTQSFLKADLHTYGFFGLERLPAYSKDYGLHARNPPVKSDDLNTKSPANYHLLAITEF